MATKQNNKIFNPFEGRDREEVWEEIRKYATPTTREEAMRIMTEAYRQKINDSDAGTQHDGLEKA